MDEQDTARVSLLFLLPAGCRNSQYSREVLALGKDLDLTRDINSNRPRINALDDSDLETDGHLPRCYTASLWDIQPSAELRWPRNHEVAADVQQVAQELREIAAQLEHNIVAQATNNLRRNISSSHSQQWKKYLTTEVEWVMKHAVGLDHLRQEQLMMALTLTLVKGVCMQAPQFLRNLFNTALQYIISARDR